MTNLETHPKIDHRHPALVDITLSIVGTAVHAAKRSQRTVPELVRVAARSLRATDLGEHREVAVGGIAHAAGLTVVELLSAYDSHVPADDQPRTVKQLEEELCTSVDYDLEELVAAVVRFEACHHVLLVKKFVTQYVSRQDPQILNRKAEELFAYGYTGLSNALRGYDPSKHTLSTYAHFRINGAVRDGVRAESPVPKRLTTFVRAVESVEEDLTRELSRPPTRQEVTGALGDQARYLHLYPRLRRQVSMEDLVGYSPVADDDVEETVSLLEVRGALQEEMSDLTPLEQTAVQLIYADGLSSRAAAKETGHAPSELDRAAKKAMAKLRQSARLQALANPVAA